jgi:hypothetical protein
MRRTVAKRLRKEAIIQSHIRARQEGRQVLRGEVDGLYAYKKKVYLRTSAEPKLKLSRRQDRDYKVSDSMPARRYQDRLINMRKSKY